MKILYGVVGSGMGHAIRSAVVIQHLLDQGHEVHAVASGGAVKYLNQKFGDLTEIWGLDMVVEDNEVDRLMTGVENLKGAIQGLPGNVKDFFQVEAKFNPDVVISDFETWTWLFAKAYGLPLICVDNIQIINRCTHDPEILVGAYDDFKLAKSIVKARTPHANEYLITTFFYPEVRKRRTKLVPPILRETILRASPRQGEHLLVYQTSESFGSLPDMLKELEVPVFVYGLRRDLKEELQDGNITYKPFSDQGFVEDLASARGVIASAGFTLMSESVHLAKPYLATPIRGQFEQIMNGRYLEKLGYGMSDENLDLKTIEHFLRELPRFEENLATYARHDNSLTLGALDEFLDRVEAGML